MTEAVLKITDITVIQNEHGMTKICFHTDLPEPTWPYKGRLSVMGFMSSDAQGEWLAKHFPGVPVKFIKG